MSGFLTAGDAERIIGGDVHLLVQKAQIIGKELNQQKLTTSQIRNFFTEVRSIQNRWDLNEEAEYRQTVLLKPKLAYAAKRAKEVGKKTDAVETLAEVLTLCIDQIPQAATDKKDRFDRFVDFFEAILAYHKQNGGREY